MKTSRWRDWSCDVTVAAAYERDLVQAERVVRAVMAEVGRAVDRFRDDSDLSRINARAGKYVAVAPLTLALVDLAVSIAEETDQAVSPTVGAALLALGYDADISVVTSRNDQPATAAAATPAPSAEVVSIDHELKLIGVPRGTRLDLGSLAKAYAVDEAVRRVATHAEGPALVSIGGDLAVHDTPEDGWTLAVSETAGAPTETINITTGALTTSSVRGRRWAGRHHIVDPRTGGCAEGRWRTATVWAPSAVEANVLSTWALVDADAAAESLAAYARPARLVSTIGEVERRHGWPAADEVAETTGAFDEVAAC